MSKFLIEVGYTGATGYPCGYQARIIDSTERGVIDYLKAQLNEQLSGGLGKWEPDDGKKPVGVTGSRTIASVDTGQTEVKTSEVEVKQPDGTVVKEKKTEKVAVIHRYPATAWLTATSLPEAVAA